MTPSVASTTPAFSLMYSSPEPTVDNTPAVLNELNAALISPSLETNVFAPASIPWFNAVDKVEASLGFVVIFPTLVVIDGATKVEASSPTYCPP